LRPFRARFHNAVNIFVLGVELSDRLDQGYQRARHCCRHTIVYDTV
jgi:hypothetical protein